MTALGFTSFVGSPGATTWTMLVSSALTARMASQGPELGGLSEALLIEADPAGSKVALSYQLYADSLFTYAADTSQEPSWRNHATQIPDGQNLLSSTSSPKSVTNLLASSAERLFRQFASDQELTSVIDLGRLNPTSPTLGALDQLNSVIVLVNRASNSDIVFSTNAIKELLDPRIEVGWAVVGKNGQPNKAIKQYSEIDVVLEIPDDPAGARSLFEKPNNRILQRSALMQEADKFAQTLLQVQQAVLV